MREGYPAHPFAELFPLHDGPSLWELRNDIEKYGQREDIILYEGKVLDGRRRQASMIALDMEPRYRTFRGTEAEALAYAISANLKRRHLGEADRAMVADKIAKLPVGRPPVSEVKPSGKKGDSLKNNGQIVEKNEGQIIPSNDGINVLTREQAAKLMNVSTTDIDRWRFIQKHAPDLSEKISKGEMAFNAAWEEARKRKKAKGKKRKKTGAESEDQQDGDPDIRAKHRIESLCRRLMELAKECPEDDPWLTDRRDGFLQKIKAACDTLRSGKRDKQCPKCKGEGCRHCRETGSVPHSVVMQLSP
jgi:hypothetical protein